LFYHNIKSQTLLLLFPFFKKIIITKYRPTSITLLDVRRATNISIGLTRFQRRNISNHDIISGLITLDSSLFGLDDLSAIGSLLPTPEEASLLRLYVNKKVQDGGLPLALPEQFMVDILSDPNVPHYLSVFFFKLQHSSEIVRLEEQMRKIVNVCHKLKESEKLKVLLMTVLELGNLTNYKYSSRGPLKGNSSEAIGFKIDGLEKLRDVKSADGKMTLMNYLAEMVTLSRPDVNFLSQF